MPSKPKQPTGGDWRPIEVAVTPQTIKPIELAVTEADRERAKKTGKPRATARTTANTTSTSPAATSAPTKES